MVIKAEFNGILVVMELFEIVWETYLIMPYWRQKKELGRVKWIVYSMFASTCVSILLFHPTMFLADDRILAECPWYPVTMFFMTLDLLFTMASIAMMLMTREIWKTCCVHKEESVTQSAFDKKMLLASGIFFLCTTTLITIDTYFVACGSEYTSWVASIVFWVLICIEELPRIMSLLICIYLTSKLRDHFKKASHSMKASNDATWFDPYVQYLRELVGVELLSFGVICAGVLLQVSTIVPLFGLSPATTADVDCVG